VAIKELLTCVLARSILVYIGTPMVAAGRWKKKDIDRIEVQLYREVHNAPNTVSNAALMNVTNNIRPAWEVVELLAAKGKLAAEHQKTLKLKKKVRFEEEHKTLNDTHQREMSKS
jgi:hypothetical protein